jgi:hypothetical protein
MKPKTFTYNQIIQLFNSHNIPLNEKQLKFITSKARFEFEKIEEYRKKRDAKRQGDKFRREQRMKDPERLVKLEKFKNGLPAPENKF